MTEIERQLYGSGLSGYLARARMKARVAQLVREWQPKGCWYCGKRHV